MAADPIRTLIVDDEPLAVERMTMLCATLPAVTVVGTAEDGETALQLIASLSPDLLLLDIAMPDLDGLTVARALDGQARRPAIVFCTAFEKHAVAAFDVAATDYLLKPVTVERLGRTVMRVRERLADLEAASAAQWLGEFWVPHRDEIIRIDALDVDRIEAERDYVRLYVGARSFLLHRTMTALVGRLDPDRFVRLHRSAIVRRDKLARLRHDGLGVWTAVLIDGTEQRVSRSFLPAARGLIVDR